MPRDIKGQHIAEVAAMLCDLLVDIAAKHLRFIGEWTGAEGVLGIEGKSDVLHLIRSRKIPCRSLMAPMLTLHEVPTIIRVGCQRPLSEVGFYAGTAIKCRIGMAIVICKVEKTVDASIEGDGKMPQRL